MSTIIPPIYECQTWTMIAAEAVSRWKSSSRDLFLTRKKREKDSQSMNVLHDMQDPVPLTGRDALFPFLLGKSNRSLGKECRPVRGLRQHCARGESLRARKRKEGTTFVVPSFIRRKEKERSEVYFCPTTVLSTALCAGLNESLSTCMHSAILDLPASPISCHSSFPPG